MSITTYSGLLSRLGQMVTFDSDGGSADVSTLQSCIALAEDRIYREVMSGYNQASISGTITSNTFSLPTNWRNPGVVHFGKLPLIPVSETVMQEELWKANTGDCRFFCTTGRSLIFAPTVADGTSLQGTYYKALDALDATTTPTNTLFTANNDLFLFAAMAESAIPFGFQDMLPYYEGKYQEAKRRVNEEHQRTAYNAGRIVRRSSFIVMR